MQPDEHDILIWDSEIHRPRIGAIAKRQPRRRAAFILDDPLTTATHPDDDQRRLSD
jgi:hypothetical protein